MSNLLDTCIVPQELKPKPNEAVLAWMRRTPREDSFLSVVTLQEIRTGIELLSAGAKREKLEHWFQLLKRRYASRILPVTVEIAEQAGVLLARARLTGFEPNSADAVIAATAVVHGLSVATLDRKHFTTFGVTLVDF